MSYLIMFLVGLFFGLFIILPIFLLAKGNAGNAVFYEENTTRKKKISRKEVIELHKKLLTINTVDEFLKLM